MKIKNLEKQLLKQYLNFKAYKFFFKKFVILEIFENFKHFYIFINSYFLKINICKFS